MAMKKIMPIKSNIIQGHYILFLDIKGKILGINNFINNILWALNMEIIINLIAIKKHDKV